MRIFELGPQTVAVRCPNLDEPGVLGFTVYAGGLFYTRELRPLRMRVMISDWILERMAYAGMSRVEAARCEALMACRPQLQIAEELGR